MLLMKPTAAAKSSKNTTRNTISRHAPSLKKSAKVCAQSFLKKRRATSSTCARFRARNYRKSSRNSLRKCSSPPPTSSLNAPPNCAIKSKTLRPHSNARSNNYSFSQLNSLSISLPTQISRSDSLPYIWRYTTLFSIEAPNQTVSLKYSLNSV